MRKKRFYYEYDNGEFMEKIIFKGTDLIKFGFVFVLLILLFNAVGYWDTHYTAEGHITEVSGDLATVRTSTEVWTFYGTDYSRGDDVILTFYNNGTSEKYDDEIIKAEKVLDK